MSNFWIEPIPIFNFEIIFCFVFSSIWWALKIKTSLEKILIKLIHCGISLEKWWLLKMAPMKSKETKQLCGRSVCDQMKLERSINLKQQQFFYHFVDVNRSKTNVCRLFTQIITMFSAHSWTFLSSSWQTLWKCSGEKNCCKR